MGSSLKCFNSKLGLNLKDGGAKGIVSEQGRENMKIAQIKLNKNRIISDETRQKISVANSGANNGNYGKKRSQEIRNKISASHKGIKLSQERIEKSRASNTGKKRSQESRDRISKALIGRKFSIQHRINIGISMKGKKNCRLGVKLSSETKLKISLANKGKSRDGILIINILTGIFYKTVKNAWLSYQLKSIGSLNNRLNGRYKNDTPFRYA